MLPWACKSAPDAGDFEDGVEVLETTLGSVHSEEHKALLPRDRTGFDNGLELVDFSLVP